PWRPLHAQARGVVDVENPPVINIVRSHAPVSKAIGLGFDQLVQPVEARGLAATAIDIGFVVVDETAVLRRTDAQFRELAFARLSFLSTYRDSLRIELIAPGQLAESR